MLRKLLVVLAAFAVGLTMLATPSGQAATAPTASSDGVFGTPQSGFQFNVYSSRGRVSAIDWSTLQVTALGVTYTTASPELTGLDWYYTGDGDIAIVFHVTTTDPALQPQSGDDFTDTHVSVTITWRTVTSYDYDRHTIRGSFSKNGVNTASRSWKGLRPGGNCKYASLNGSLLVSCLWARSTVVYNMTAPRVHHHRTRITRIGLPHHAGLFACHTSVSTRRVSKRTIRVTAVTSNAGGFAQCWLDKVKARYRGHYTTKTPIYTEHSQDAVAEWHAV